MRTMVETLPFLTPERRSSAFTPRSTVSDQPAPSAPWQLAKYEEELQAVSEHSRQSRQRAADLERKVADLTRRLEREREQNSARPAAVPVAADAEDAAEGARRAALMAEAGERIEELVKDAQLRDQVIGLLHTSHKQEQNMLDAAHEAATGKIREAEGKRREAEALRAHAGEQIVALQAQLAEQQRQARAEAGRLSRERGAAEDAARVAGERRALEEQRAETLEARLARLEAAAEHAAGNAGRVAQQLRSVERALADAEHAAGARDAEEARAGSALAASRREVAEGARARAEERETWEAERAGLEGEIARGGKTAREMEGVLGRARAAGGVAVGDAEGLRREVESLRGMVEAGRREEGGGKVERDAMERGGNAAKEALARSEAGRKAAESRAQALAEELEQEQSASEDKAAASAALGQADTPPSHCAEWHGAALSGMERAMGEVQRDTKAAIAKSDAALKAAESRAQ
ncbi:hypothetical protein T484DRAFT_1819408, partial [Baffinella frigidus]